MKTKPKYLTIKRNYYLNGQTFKVYYFNKVSELKHRNSKIIKYDKCKKEIMKDSSVIIRALYNYLVYKYGQLKFTYIGLKSFKLKTGEKIEVNVRFEKLIGEKVQVDWYKDTITISSIRY